ARCAFTNPESRSISAALAKGTRWIAWRGSCAAEDAGGCCCTEAPAACTLEDVPPRRNAVGRLRFCIRGTAAAGWRAYGCAIARWEHQRPRTSTWNITDESWATYSIRERAGRLAASPALRYSLP